MNQVAINIKEIPAAGKWGDDMDVPDFVEQSGHVKLWYACSVGCVYGRFRHEVTLQSDHRGPLYCILDDRVPGSLGSDDCLAGT